jgi:hypothetical protein
VASEGKHSNLSQSIHYEDWQTILDAVQSVSLWEGSVPQGPDLRRSLIKFDTRTHGSGGAAAALTKPTPTLIG